MPVGDGALPYAPIVEGCGLWLVTSVLAPSVG
jgi:hypothetical protein